MNSKSLNQNILIISQVLNLLIIIFFAVILAKFIWWIITPSITEVYVEKTTVSQFDNSVKYVINRHPFGIMVENKAPLPSIMEKIKLSGVYLNTSKNSIAFFDIDSKHVIAKIGDDIAEGVILKSIKGNKAIVLFQGQELAILLSGGTAQPVEPQTNSNNEERFKTPYSMPNKPYDYENRGNNKAVDEIRERRRQLIEEFEKQSLAGQNNKDNERSQPDRINKESSK